MQGTVLGVSHVPVVPVGRKPWRNSLKEAPLGTEVWSGRPNRQCHFRVTRPPLFSAEAAEATYECVIIRMSDVIGFESASSFGTCEANVAYEQDIYREGQTDWKDADLNPIIGTGTDAVPSNDHVAVVMTTDPTAAIGRGFSSNQVIALASPLVVPGQSTFYWNGQGSVTTEPGYPCGLQPGAPAFQ